MRSRDVIQLYDIVGPRARVTILNEPLEAMVPSVAPGPAVSDAMKQ
jgi:hypothetical protein